MKVDAALLLATFSVVIQGEYEAGDAGVPLQQQKAIASSHWGYRWGPPPYGSLQDVAGVLQIVNAGSEPMWIRYSGTLISSGAFYWKPFITQASELNGNKAHKWTQLNTYNMTGQGDGFHLYPGEYQIVPFAGNSCWIGGSLGCCKHGNNCIQGPNGRGSGQDASPSGQPNTLFEWTVPGVWDCSAVDGFSLPMKVEIDGCGPPFSGKPSNCPGSDPIVFLNFSEYFCPNDVRTDEGVYVGCKSMCGCQYYALNNDLSTDPACPSMENVLSIVNQPDPPGGYCGCSESECPTWLRNFFNQDPAGITYCDAVTSMTKNTSGIRQIYCQAYDDNAGLQSYGNGIIKAYLYNKGFESITDRADIC